jgi:hypothetical protein
VVEPAAQALPSGPALTPINCPGMGLNGSRWLAVAGGRTVTPGAGVPQATRPPRPASSAAVPAAAGAARRRRDRPARGAAGTHATGQQTAVLAGVPAHRPPPSGLVTLSPAPGQRHCATAPPPATQNTQVSSHASDPALATVRQRFPHRRIG